MKFNYKLLAYLEKNGFHSNNWMKQHNKPMRRIRQYKKLRKYMRHTKKESKYGKNR